VAVGHGDPGGGNGASAALGGDGLGSPGTFGTGTLGEATSGGGGDPASAE
jgi:hypothetical protein